MIKKPFGTYRPGGRVPRLTPPAKPDWFKRTSPSIFLLLNFIDFSKKFCQFKKSS